MIIPGIVKKILPISALIIASLIIIFPIFNPGFLVNSDNPVHQAEVHYLIEDLLPQHHWFTGWCNYDFAGFPIFLYSYNLGYWIIAILTIFLGINIETAYKLVVYISYIFPVISLYILIERRFGYKIAFISSMMFLVSIYDLKIIISGMWNQYLSVGFLLLFIHESEYYFENPNLKNTTILGILLAFIVLSHPFSAIVAFYYMLIYLLIVLSVKKLNEIKSFLKEKLLLSILWMGLIAFSLTWYFIIPVIETSGSMKSVIGIPTGSIFQSLCTPIIVIFFMNSYQLFAEKNFLLVINNFFLILIQNLPQLIMGIITVCGCIFLIKTFYKRSTNQFYFVILLFTIISYLISTGIISTIFVSMHMPPITLTYNRWYVYAEIGIFILFGFSLFHLKQIFIDSSISDYVRQKFNSNFVNRVDLNNILICIFLIILMVNFSYTYTTNIKPYLRISSSDKTFSQTSEVWSWISNNVDGSKTRVYYQSFEQNHDYSSGNISAIWALSTIHTNVSSLGGWNAGYPYRIEDNIKSIYGCIFNIPITDISDAQIKNNLELFNAKYIVTLEPNLTKKLDQSKLFKKEKEISKFTIFSIIDYSPEWVIFKNNVTYKILTYNDDRVIIKISNNTENNTMLFKTQYHPYWHAVINNETVKISKDQHYLILLDLPPEPDITINLFYRPFPTFFYR
jgi:uncharacterized membrane protein